MNKRLSKIGPPPTPRRAEPEPPASDDEEDYGLRAICRGIIKDPTASASDKLRAGERLAQLPEEHLDTENLRRYAEMPEEELDEITDHFLYVDVIEATLGHPRHELEDSTDLAAEEAARKFPLSVAALHEHLEARAEELAREMVAARQSEPEAGSPPVTPTPTPEPAETCEIDGADEVPIELAPEVPSPTVERGVREPYHGWTAGYAV